MVEDITVLCQVPTQSVFSLPQAQWTKQTKEISCTNFHIPIKQKPIDTKVGMDT
jgi:hypothetical protein